MTGASAAAPVTDAVVQLTGVGRKFHRPGGGTVTALDGVDLTIPRGSAFGVVGESGSGKTTLMRIIAGLEKATSGRVLVDGTDITALPEKRLTFLRKTLQVVFQDPMGSLNPRMTIGRIVAEPLVVQGHRDVSGRVAEVLEQVGLDATIVGRYPHQFSGGQRQRISIARAIAPDPAVLIADEAVSALDVTVRAQVLDLIAEIAARRSLTLIFVSHDLSVIRRVCDRVAVLQGGRLVETGAVQRVYDHPEQAYTRRLLAAVPRLAESLEMARARAAGNRGGRSTTTADAGGNDSGTDDSSTDTNTEDAR
ncbi:ABC transporter ATP-binding protein [Nakamurella lactea]|uniref:ABC transporter ATP-binding protein n=1 Tax=Nakamurella lactea TaxID=459515 RepID=UPI0003F6FC2E|nr:ABC transporter ATP-binding protein [Nakamurella lactea]